MQTKQPQCDAHFSEPVHKTMCSVLWEKFNRIFQGLILPGRLTFLLYSIHFRIWAALLMMPRTSNAQFINMRDEIISAHSSVRVVFFSCWAGWGGAMQQMLRWDELSLWLLRKVSSEQSAHRSFPSSVQIQRHEQSAEGPRGEHRRVVPESTVTRSSHRASLAWDVTALENSAMWTWQKWSTDRKSNGGEGGGGRGGQGGRGVHMWGRQMLRFAVLYL